MASPPEQDREGARSAPSLRTHLYNALAHLGGAILAVMTLAVFVQVVLRYFGLTGIDGLEEVPRYLFVWLVMLGAAAMLITACIVSMAESRSNAGWPESIS